MLSKTRKQTEDAQVARKDERGPRKDKVWKPDGLSKGVIRRLVGRQTASSAQNPPSKGSKSSELSLDGKNKGAELEGIKEDKNVNVSHRDRYDHLQQQETKLCYLLCSLFPDEIDLEALVRYAWGLRLYRELDTIEKTRSMVNKAIKELRDCSLLLECEKGHMKMERQVAIQIASEEEQCFMAKHKDPSECPDNEIPVLFGAISLIAAKIKVPLESGCSKLEISLPGEDSWGSSSHASPEQMKAVTVFSPHNELLLPDAAELPTNLRTLHLGCCRLIDLSLLGKLKKLEILSFHGTNITELPDEIGELNGLKLLDLTCCRLLSRIPCNLIQKLSELQELYIGNKSFKEWTTEGAATEVRNASLSELQSLSHLSVLTLSVDSACFPKDFAFPRLERYELVIDEGDSSADSSSSSITITEFHPNVMKELFSNIKNLELDDIISCKDLIPSLDKGGLKELTSLVLRDCHEIESLIDARKDSDEALETNAEENHEEILPKLTKLELLRLPELSCILAGSTTCVTLKSLKIVKISSCNKLTYLFTSALAQTLKQLVTLEVNDCSELERMLSEEEDGNVIELPQLRKLLLRGLKKMKSFCQQAYLPSLEELKVKECPELKSYVNFGAEKESKSRVHIKEVCLSKANTITCQLCNDSTSKLKKKSPNFEHLKIGSCQEVLTQLQEGYFSRLEKLVLKEIYPLEVIWKDPHQIPTFQGLACLEVVRCKGLKSIFSLIIARNLPQLSILKVDQCMQLEQVITKNQKSSSLPSSSKVHRQPVYFPNLEEVFISKCHKLKGLFPVSIVQFPKLKKFQVKEAQKLKTIFTYEDGADVKDKKEIQLPELKELLLKGLPVLRSVAPVGYHLIFSNLNSLEVETCPKMATTFSKVSKHIHAKMEEATAAENDAYELSHTVRPIPASKNGDIKWHRGERKPLPNTAT